MEKWENEEYEKESLTYQKISRGLSKSLETKLNKTYKPSSRIDGTFRGNDITYFTNENGEPVTLFIGKRRENGQIDGEFYSRRIKEREGDKITKSHWDNQGKASGKMKKY